MIKKSELIEFIERYSLGGILDVVKWNIDSDKKTIYMGGTTDDSNIDVECTLKNNYDIQSLNVGIKSTIVLKKMLSVLNEDINSISPSFRGDLVTKLKFNDGLIEVNYVGCDLSIIKPYVPIKKTGELVLSIQLSDILINKFLKIKNAMNNDKLFKIIKNNDKVILSIGYSDRNTDRININVDCNNDNFPDNFPLAFNAEYFKQILTNNDGESVLNIYCNNDKYISIIEYETDLYKTKYVLYQRLDDEL